VSDGDVVRQSALVVSGNRVEIYQHGITVDPKLLEILEEAYARVEALTGRKLDTATLGPRVRVYVSDAISVSHVWNGYEHPRDPRGIILLNRRAYLGALSGTNATYAHEMTHLFTWRYSSHTLREGIADYVAVAVRPGAGVGPNAQGHDLSARIPKEVVDCLGTTQPAPAWLTGDATYRRFYYLASYRFVKSLIEDKGMEVFMRLYDSERPETEMPALYGASREDLIRRAGM
jgi:hypothetical protein